MISKELIEDYKKIFILCLEVAGEKTGNKLLKNVENNLDDQLVDALIYDISKYKDVGMGDVICVMLSTLLVPTVLGINSTEDFNINSIVSLPEKINEVSEKAANLYRDYLMTASEKFCESKGIELRVDFKKMSNSNIIK